MKIPAYILKTQMGLYSQSDVARLLHVNTEIVSSRKYMGLIPAPLVQIDSSQRRYYTQADFDIIKAHFEKPQTVKDAQGLWTLTKMSEMLGIGLTLLQARIADGHVDPPKIKEGERLYYRPMDLKKLKRQIKIAFPRKQGCHWTEREAEGWYGICPAARKLGIPKVTLESWLKNGRLPKPSHQVGLYFFYTEEEVDQLWQTMKEKGYRPQLESVKAKLHTT